MASTQASDKLFANQNMTMLVHNPTDATVEVATGWVDLRDYENFAVGMVTSLLPSGTGPTVFEIIADADADGGDGNVIIKAHALGSLPNAVGDVVWLECTAEEIRQLGVDNTKELRYVSANVDANHANDEAVLVYVRSGARFPQDGLTADAVS